METITVKMPRGGAAETIAAMDDASRYNIGRSTYNFVRRAMRDPETRRLIEEKVAQMRAAGKFN